MAPTMELEVEDGLYPMRVVTRLTGLNADTIRVWERRYGAVEPPRTEGRARRFTATDVRRLLLLREATARGHAIRDVALRSEEELRALLADTGALEQTRDTATPADGADAHARLRAEYLATIARFDVRRAGDLLARAAMLLEPTDFVLNVVAPILVEVGEAWHDAELSIAHEHVISAQVKSMLFALMRFAAAQPGARKVLVTTPEGHLHEFGALIGAFIAAARGYEPVYLGPNLPERDTVVALDLSRADLLLLSVVRDLDGPALAPLAASVARLSQRVEVWIGLPVGHPAAAALPDARVFHSYHDLDAALTDRLL